MANVPYCIKCCWMFQTDTKQQIFSVVENFPFLSCSGHKISNVSKVGLVGCCQTPRRIFSEEEKFQGHIMYACRNWGKLREPAGLHILGLFWLSLPLNIAFGVFRLKSQNPKRILHEPCRKPVPFRKAATRVCHPWSKEYMFRFSCFLFVLLLSGPVLVLWLDVKIYLRS